MEDALLPSKQRVAGSSPAAPTNLFNKLAASVARLNPACDADCDVTGCEQASSVQLPHSSQLFDWLSHQAGMGGCGG